MSPPDSITEWRAHAPWVTDVQVEQDLVIRRALVELFSRPLVASALAFRGGTALYKLHLVPAARYSEDIDLVQIEAGPIGPVLKEVRAALDPWLGEPSWKQSEGRVTLNYREERVRLRAERDRSLAPRRFGRCADCVAARQPALVTAPTDRASFRPQDSRAYDAKYSMCRRGCRP